MERATNLSDRLEGYSSGTVGAAVTSLEINTVSNSSKFVKTGGQSTALVKSVDDGAVGEELRPENEARSAAAHVVTVSSGNRRDDQAASMENTAKTTVKTSVHGRTLSSDSNSVLSKRRRLKRNLSVAAVGSVHSAVASGDKMSSAPSSTSLNSRSLDRKVVPRRRPAAQLHRSDREWVRADLQRGCVHVHDRFQPPCLWAVLCTQDTTAGEIARRLSQLGSKAGKVVRVVGKSNPSTDSGDSSCLGRRCAFGNGQHGQYENEHLNSQNSTDCAETQSPRPDDSLRLLLLASQDSGEQQLDANLYTPDSQSEGSILRSTSSDTNAKLNPGGLNGDEYPFNHSGTDVGSDAESSAFDDVSSGARLLAHRDSLSDDMILGTDASALSPGFDSGAEGLDTLGSSCDELELDPPLVLDAIPQTHIEICTGSSLNTNNNRLPDGQISDVVTGDREPGTRAELHSPGKAPCSSTSSSLTGTSAVKREPANDTSKAEPLLDSGNSVPSLYVQLHGDAVRRLEENEKPLQVQNDFLFKLGFKDPWRVQEEGMETEIGSLIRFYAGKPQSVEGSERVQLSGTFNVRKGKMQLPVSRWTPRRVILCGTCLIVSSVKDSQAGKMHILPLIGGKVEEVKRHNHCLAFSSAGPQGRTYYVSFDSFTERLRWQRHASKLVSQRTSSADLSGCSLEQLPQNLFYSQDLTHLNLKHNFLCPGPSLDQLQRFFNLRSLNLSSNHLGQFPLAVCGLPALTELNLSCNYLSSVPRAVGTMRSLQTLLLDGNCLSSLPEELGDLGHLSYLGLSFNRFRQVPMVMEQLGGVERLCMAGNSLTALELRAFRLLRIKHVDLRLNRIGEVVPEEADFLRHVTQLDLRDNVLQDLDVSIFPRLEVLHCERNSLTSLLLRGGPLKALYASANELCQLEVSSVPCNLTYADVSRNRLESVPDWLSESKQLEVLDISHNQISELPDRLFSSSSLRKLLAGHNQLQRLPRLLENIQVEVLDIQHNLLLELPYNLFLKAKRLRCLNASANKLESLPPSSQSEESQSILQELYLTNNRLSDKCVPHLTGHCRLRVLHLAYNHLQSFPASKMAKLEALEELDVSGNRLRAVPTTILSCRRMHTLAAHSNCLQAFPDVLQLADIKCVDVSCNELSEVTLPEILPSKLQELDLTGNPRLNLDHKTLELLNNIRCFRIDPPPASFPTGEPPGGPAVWSHGYTESSGVKNKLCVAALAVGHFCESREALYGVFDGDRNVEVPYLLQCTMGDVLSEELHKTKSEEDYMTNTFLVMQRKLGTAGQKLGGSGALCHIKHDPMDPGGCFTLTAANVGKCQAILCRDGKPLPLSVPHSVRLEEEFRRTQLYNAIITEDNKVNGVTDSTRIMGYSFLYPSVVPRPHVQTVALTPRDEFLVLGSRGLWDSVGPEEAAEAVRNVPDPLAAAKKLCTLAQGYGCTDSLSAVVVRLSISQDCCCYRCCSELGPAPPPSPSPAHYRHPASASSCSEISSGEVSEMSSEAGSTASSDEPPPAQRLPPPPPPTLPRCTLHPLLSGSFQRQLSSATFSSALSDDKVEDSEDEEPIAGVFSNGSRVEVEVDVHCLRTLPLAPPPPPPTPEALDEEEAEPSGDCDVDGRSLGPGRWRGNGSVVPPQRSHNLIEVAAEAPAKKPGGYFNAPTQPDPDDQLIIPPELEEEVRVMMKQHQQQQQRAPPTDQPADCYDTPL
ncbi:hypothetical protein AGOR_G00033250 [Albula goreensis]|uniref:PH domain leucine-rich repeat-containing protein phosphatase 2 n=1 Tax=Albula goreensis TaxID=1534307 RepID=A0A8T3E3Y7_9TELE|nr:hypothetical protein AGOR_G00033250 [Albula goreensis]